MSKLESKFTEYLNNNSLTPKLFAKEIGVDIKTLKKFISGKIYPSKHIMEKIVVATEGCIQPMDFLFLYSYEFSIIDYIKYHVGLKLITPKELALELNLNFSNFYRRLRGEVKFKKGEIKKVLSTIERAKISPKRAYNVLTTNK